MSLNIMMSSGRGTFWWKCALHCRGRFEKCQYPLLIAVPWLIMRSGWRDWKDMNQRWSRLEVERRNHILCEPFTLSAELLLPPLLMWTRNCGDPLLRPWRRVTAGSWRGLNSWYCATIVVRKDIFVPIAHTCWRTMPIRYRLLRHWMLALPLNVQKTWRGLSDLEHWRAVT